MTFTIRCKLSQAAPCLHTEQNRDGCQTDTTPKVRPHHTFTSLYLLSITSLFRCDYAGTVGITAGITAQVCIFNMTSVFTINLMVSSSLHNVRASHVADCESPSRRGFTVERQGIGPAYPCPWLGEPRWSAPSPCLHTQHCRKYPHPHPLHPPGRASPGSTPTSDTAMFSDTSGCLNKPEPCESTSRETEKQGELCE